MNCVCGVGEAMGRLRGSRFGPIGQVIRLETFHVLDPLSVPDRCSQRAYSNPGMWVYELDHTSGALVRRNEDLGSRTLDQADDRTLYARLPLEPHQFVILA